MASLIGYNIEVDEVLMKVLPIHPHDQLSYHQCPSRAPDNTVITVVGHVQLVAFKVADNRDNGMEVQETDGVWRTH